MARTVDCAIQIEVRVNPIISAFLYCARKFPVLLLNHTNTNRYLLDNLVSIRIGNRKWKRLKLSKHIKEG